MLEYPFETFYGPQRSVDHSVYVGDGKEVSSANLHSSDLQKALTYISDIDREKFVRIQREAAKETYLDEIIDNLPWIKYRPAVLQSALITLPVSGSEAYKSWPASYEFESDDVILDQIAEDKSKVRSMGTDPHGFTPDPTSGHAWSVPEIARKYIKGALKKYELQDFIRYYEKALDVLAGADVDYRAEK